MSQEICIFDGEYYRYYTDGNLYQMEIKNPTPMDYLVLKVSNSYKNGIIDGISISYYDSGQIKCMKSYENGILHGKCKYFKPDGNIECEFNYDNGLAYPKCFQTYVYPQNDQDMDIPNVDPYLGILKYFKMCKNL
jgi:antitoxin component YwqK of YwqJK toxin-antitoxin module